MTQALTNSPTDTGKNKPSDRQQPSKLLRFFFLQPIFGILLALLLTVGGILGYLSMVKQSNPDIDIATATITTTWGGADPDTIEQQV
ncbi:MAG: efflux RND transporter permease subunit, partial [Cyanobacteria bacterium J06631_9]